MLQAMRKYAKGWVASVFLGLLALSFGVWGIADIFRGGGDDSVEPAGDQLVSAAASALDLRPGSAHAFFHYLNEVRAATYVTVPASAARNTPTPDDVALMAYMKAHETQFSTPKYRDVSFASISPQ